MTVASSINTATYTGNGVTTNFPFSFLIPLDTAQVTITTIATGLEGDALDPSLYTINGEDNDAGGSIDYPLVGSPLSSDYKINIKRVVPISQELSLSNQSGFLPEVLEDQLDRIVMMIAQQAEQIDRAVLVGTGSGQSPEDLIDALAAAAAAAAVSAAAADASADDAAAQVALAAAQVTLAAGQVTLAAGQVTLATTQAGNAATSAAAAAASAASIGITNRQVAVFTALNNQPPTSNYATLDTRNSHPVLDFDTTTQETAIFQGCVPSTYAGGGLTVVIAASLTSATSGTLGWDVAFENMLSQDIDSDGFATAKTATAAAVPGTSGQLQYHTLSFSNSEIDGLAAGDNFRIRLRRDVANDNAAGDAEMNSLIVSMT